MKTQRARCKMGISLTWPTVGVIVCALLSMAFITPLAADDIWIRKADMPTPRTALATAKVDGKIYAIGGMNNQVPKSATEEYNPSIDNWETKANMPTARMGLVTATVNGKIYAIGGATAGWQAVPTVEEYDPKTNKWIKKADMPSQRYYSLAVVVDSRVYVIGGEGTGDQACLAVETYDPVTDEWDKLKDMPAKFHVILSVACVVEGKIYIAGGNNAVSWALHQAVLEYDPEDEEWEEKARIPTERFGLTGGAVNGKIYAIGGMQLNLQILSAVEEYDVAEDGWTRKTDIPSRRSHFGSSSVVNDRIYVIGGTPSWPAGLSTVEEYTPEGWPFPVSRQSKLAVTWGSAKLSR